ncbi:unnamed protein product [Caenorhabditis angaria]|uniref:Uncharacterized protein n=1 Tax=Caenorhabditis angaria TaxID=860376 RepID=A0A9P1MTX1_9PELO|nr:unnamed protein product [Caenorhabditis angaria]
MSQNCSSENSTPNCSSDGPFICQSYLSQPSEIPSNDCWYHGELEENGANRLLKGSQTGTFLVRRNGKTRYYLSIIDSEHNIKHLPIRQINSVFFFEGKKFGQLHDIVSIYKHAKFPFRKDDNVTIYPTQEYLGMKYICIRTFEAEDVNDLNAEPGDILSVSETDDITWFIGRNEKNGSIGMVPSEYIEPLVIEVETMFEVRYFHDTDLTDSVKFQQLVEKFLIVGSPSRGFNVAGRTFRTIGNVINRYCERSISGGVRLTHAIFEDVKQKPISTLQKKKTRRVFRGVSIDTSILVPTASTSSSSFLSPAPSSSPDNIISSSTTNNIIGNTSNTDTKIMFDHFNEEDYNDNLETLSTIIATSSALRKSREDKSWKECWLSLSDLSCGSSQLAIFDSMGSKRRQLIDLSACTLFWLDETVFGVDGCVYISANYPQQAPIFLCFRPYSAFLKWIRLIRLRTIFQDVPPSMSQSTISYNEPISQMSILCVEVEKYRSDTLKSDMLYSANVLLNGIKICSSNSFAPTNNKNSTDLPVVIIDSKFVLPCIPTCNTSVQLAIVGHSSSTNKRGRPCGVSSPITLSDSSSTSSIHHIPPADIGFTFRAEKHRFPILQQERYRPLLDAIRDLPTELFQWPSQVLPQQHKIFLYSCISHLYTMDPLNMSNVFRRIISDVLISSTPEDVFRKDSMATGIVTQVLRHLFKTPFDEFLTENASFVQACKNQNIEQAVELLVNFVDQRLLTIPLACRLLAVCAECAKTRFIDEPHVIKRTLSALLILRVLNPIIFTTLNNGGIGSQVAKLVQTCANSAASQTCAEQLTETAATIRRAFDRIIILSDQKEDVIITDNDGFSMSSEWLSSIAHLIGFSLNLKSSAITNNGEQLTQEDVHNTLPLAVLELVRLHQ